MSASWSNSLSFGRPVGLLEPPFFRCPANSVDFTAVQCPAGRIWKSRKLVYPTHTHTLTHTRKKIYCQEMGEKIINKFFVLYFGSTVVVLPLPVPSPLPLATPRLPTPRDRSCAFYFLLVCFVAGFVIYSKSVPFWLYIEVYTYKHTSLHTDLYIQTHTCGIYICCEGYFNNSYTLDR